VPATNLKDAYNSMEDREPLKNIQLDEYYVNRPEPFSIRKKIKTILYTSNTPQKILLPGHIDCGKSTELNKLSEELKEDFFIVKYSVFDNLDINNLSYIDILLTMQAKILQKAKDENVRIKQEIIKELGSWISRIIKITIQISKISIENISDAFSNIVNILKYMTEERKRIRESTQEDISMLIDKLTQIIDEIEKQTKKEVLIIIDDIDKTGIELAKNIFYNYGKTLTQPKCNIIYTIPISLFYSPVFNQIKQDFGSADCLPNIKISDIDCNPYQDGRNFLKSVIEKRMLLDLIEKDALEYLIDVSGGVIGELIRFTKESCIIALASGKNKINKASVDEVVRNRRIAYQRQLTKKDYDILKDVHKKEGVSKDDTMLELLHSLALIEHIDGDRWYIVHPVIQPLLEIVRD
jgi:hypothetical protein